MSSTDQLPSRYPLSGINVLIVGAGVSGLLAALECWRKGHNVRIIESRSGHNPNGDIFHITPPAVSTFQHWPWMCAELARIGDDDINTVRKQDGSLIASPFRLLNTKLDSVPIPAHLRLSPLYRRPHFVWMMISQLERIGISIEWGKKVTAYHETADLGTVTLEDGSSISADLVLAADGLHTASWSLIKGAKMTISSGYSIFRAAWDTKVALSNPEVRKSLFDLGIYPDEPSFALWYGPDMHGHMAVTSDYVAIGLTHKDTSVGGATESYSDPVPVESLYEAMDQAPGWSSLWKELGKTLPDGKIVDFKLLFRSPNPRWTSPEARVLQIGDSAHTFIPTSGNGAVQAMEDAISIATCLQIGGRSNVTWAAKVHTELRFERVTCIQKIGFINRDLFQKSESEALAKDPLERLPRLTSWQYAHRPEQYAIDNYGRALNHLVAGTPFQVTNTPPGHEFKTWTVEQLLEESENGGIKIDGDWFDEPIGKLLETDEPKVDQVDA